MFLCPECAELALSGCRIGPLRMSAPPFTNAVFSLLVVLAILFSGCDRTRHTYDPHLRKIDELLSAHLPTGTPRGQVQYFLKSRGYQLESHDKTVVRAVVRQVDTDTLQPAAARVTFHFDVNDKLTTYELEAVPVGPS
jgi:hypothetical protein